MNSRLLMLATVMLLSGTAASGQVWVYTATGGVPNLAMAAGTDLDGKTLYICRAPYQGASQIGKTSATLPGCVFAYNGQQVVIQSYQVLTDFSMDWLPASGSNLPSNAFQLGDQGPAVYACRTMLEGTLQVGQVRAGSAGCEIAIDGTTAVITSYSVLWKPWMAATGGNIPPNAVQSSTDTDGGALYVCRGYNASGVLYVGKVRSTFTGCNTAGGIIASHEVLTGLNGSWVAYTSAVPDGGAWYAGSQGGKALYVCRFSSITGETGGSGPFASSCEGEYGGFLRESASFEAFTNLLFTICSYTVNGGTSTISVPPSGSSFLIQVLTTCGWAARTDVPWARIVAPNYGTGSGTFTVVVDQGTTSTRTGHIYVGGKTITITENSVYCSPAFAPSSITLPPAGGNGTITVTAPSYCIWQISSSDTWINISTGLSYTGSADVKFTVGQFSTGRQGAINFPRDVNVTVKQTACSYTLAPPSVNVPASGGSGDLTVTTQATCSWAPTIPPSSFATISSGLSGSGPGTIHYTIPPNPAASQRTTSITVNGSSTTITQEGTSCTYSISPASASAQSSGGTVATSVTAPTGCSWSATSSTTWLTVRTGSPGSGNGSVSVDVSANPDPAVRIGLVTVAGKAFTVTQSGTTPVTLTSGLRFVAMPPCRVADTRNANGPLGGPVMSAGSSRTLPVPQSSCGVPANAQAYSLNVTVVPRGPLGYLTLWPTGQSQPFVSTLNALNGGIVANAAIVPAGTAGAIDMYVTDATDVVLDINGYFAPSDVPSGLQFFPVAPCRISDTRNAAGPLGAPSLVAGNARSFPIPASTCGIPSTAQAYSLNATVVPHGALGYLTLWPTGQSQPLVSTLNAPDGSIVANAAIVPAGTGGAISAYVTNATDLVLDINGYFAPPASGGLSFYPVAPCRVLDTRNTVGALGGPPMNAASSRSFPVGVSSCSVPATAQAYSLNATVVPPGPLGYLTLWPTGGNQPFVSTLNSGLGHILANAAIVPAGSNGAVSAYVTNDTDLVLDINGYFAP